MVYVKKQISDGIATLIINRGKVNALNGDVIDQLHGAFRQLETDKSIKAIILAGEGKFFSFGFDIPEFFPYPREEFSKYLVKFTDLYTYMFLYPKPIVAALNGHTVAGGCMLALACDSRIMVSGKGKVSLNEIGFGSSVFAGCTEMLRFWVGSKNATKVLYSGAMYSAEDAKILGLIDEVTTEDKLIETASMTALDLGDKYGAAFASIKKLLRKSIVEEMKRNEKESIKEFLDIWYSEHTRENLKNIEIY